MHRIFGIRHHGPGSASSLKEALERMQPDIVLLEGPPDAEDILHYIGKEGLVPPVAILIYNPKELRQASFYPFAEFSPEWVAIEYAHRKKIPVWHIDLPISLKYGLDAQEEEALPDEIAEREPELAAITSDPLGYMARLAGYEDSERWWEATFELHRSDTDVFEASLMLMNTLRKELNAPESPLTLRREAQMRIGIRKAYREMYQNIAVVCGAWHGPALLNPDEYKVKDDNDLLKGIKKVPVKCTWIPWTYQRLARMSGYGAGIVSPAWYKLLYHNREDAVKEWMVKVAQLLRKEDLDASSAHIIEAVRLADAIAALREHELPGIDELREAAVAIFCNGYDTQMELIEKKLIIGDTIGQVPSDIPVIPFQENFEAICKSLRMKPYQTEELHLDLDLRQDAHLEKSQFLHRLSLLHIGWGQKKGDGGPGAKGTFWEYWKLQWIPEFSLNIIEAGTWGNTVFDAAVAKIMHEATEANTLPEIVRLLDLGLNAGLGPAIVSLSKRLQDMAAVTKDVTQLTQALPRLVNIYRYGDVRGTDQEAVMNILEQLVPRIIIGLPPTCVGLGDEATEEMFKHLLAAHHALATLGHEEFKAGWYGCLEKMSGNNVTPPKIAGICARMLHDARYWETGETAQQMRYALSRANKPGDAARWLEGFLYGSGLLLIHSPELWGIVDEWVSELPFDLFQEQLPLLRRTFSLFPNPERKKMLDLAKKGPAAVAVASEKETMYDEGRAKLVLGVLRGVLG